VCVHVWVSGVGGLCLIHVLPETLTLTVQTHVRIHNPQGLAATVTLAFMSTSPDVVLCDTRGMLTEETLYACLDLGRKACSKIHAFFRLSVQKRLEKGV
jgi:hypothetical protein